MRRSKKELDVEVEEELEEEGEADAEADEEAGVEEEVGVQVGGRAGGGSGGRSRPIHILDDGRIVEPYLMPQLQRHIAPPFWMIKGRRLPRKDIVKSNAPAAVRLHKIRYRRIGLSIPDGVHIDSWPARAKIIEYAPTRRACCAA